MPSNYQIIKKLTDGIVSEESKRLKILLGLCDSQIEQLFIINAYKYFHDSSLVLNSIEYLVDQVQVNEKENNFNLIELGSKLHGYMKGFKAKGGNFQYDFLPQYKVANSQFSLDIAVFYEVQLLNGKNKGEIYKQKFAIECDGKDFHSYLHQRDLDYRREKYLLEQGWTVVRYTGRELHFFQQDRDFYKVLNTLDKITLNNLKNYGIK